MVGKASAPHLYVIPYIRFLLLVDSYMDERLILLEIAFQKIGVGLGLERYVEDTLFPTLGRPSCRLAEIVDHAPVSQADHLVEIHIEIVRPHIGGVGLALIEHHPGKTPAVAGEIHIPVVVGRHIGLQSQRRRQRVGLLAAATRMHGHRHRARPVITVEQSLLHPVRSHSPVGIRDIPEELKLVAEAPHHHAGMIPVAPHPFRHVPGPLLHPVAAPSGILSQPFVIDLIHHKNAILITQVHERLAIRIMGTADVVESEILKETYPLLHGGRISRGPERPERMMVCNTFEKHLPSIQSQS